MATTRYDDTMIDAPDTLAGDDTDIAASAGSGSRLSGIASTVSDAAATVRPKISDAAATVRPKISDAAGSTAEAVRGADRAIRSTSDQGLGMVGAFSIGSAIGLLVGGANRLLIAASLVPAVMVAKTIVERMDQANGRDAGRLD